MTWLIWIAALLAAVVHLLAFVWESILFHRVSVHQGVFGIDTSDVEPIKLWAFCVGFYNLFLGSGAIAGVIAWAAGQVEVGQALIIYIGSFMFLSGIVLFISDRLALSRPRGKGVSGSIAQSLPPLIALAAIWASA